jgi:hypothetical protein
MPPSLAAAKSIKCGDSADVSEHDDNVTKGCKDFQNSLVAMKNFRGNEFIQYK